jgi:hypothetical protein
VAPSRPLQLIVSALTDVVPVTSDPIPITPMMRSANSVFIDEILS